MNKQELIEKIKANGEWFETNRYVKITKVIELVNQIDEPQKVKVPEEFDEWYQQIEQEWGKHAKKFALWKICQFGFGTGFEDVNNNRTSNALSDWVCWNNEVAINGLWNGYEVEEEPKYSVMVAGKYLIKMFHGRKDHKFVNEAELESWHSSAYKLTQKEIKEIDERYWTFAVPVEKV